LFENTWNVYANAEKSFEKYRKNDDLEKVWLEISMTSSSTLPTARLST
jgi:hypothetical protein